MHVFKKAAQSIQEDYVMDKFSECYTWSDDFISFAYEFFEFVAEQKPKLIHLLDGNPYDYTFSIAIDFLDDSQNIEFKAKSIFYAKDLYKLEVKNKIFFLTGLFDILSKDQLHILFAYLRSLIVYVEKNEMACLYAPLGSTGIDEKDFSLHADLYIPYILFNVFEDVPNDESGKSIFLSVSKFKKIVHNTELMPENFAKRILSFLDLKRKILIDGYEEFFELVHGNNPWKEELENEMNLNKLSIKLHSGEGYIINDRKWLHGRDCPSIGVSEKRLHRLIFRL